MLPALALPNLVPALLTSLRLYSTSKLHLKGAQGLAKWHRKGNEQEMATKKRDFISMVISLSRRS